MSKLLLEYAGSLIGAFALGWGVGWLLYTIRRTLDAI